MYYLLLKISNGCCEEKGIDVWLVFEVYENVVYKYFDVLVLIVSDGDFLLLVCKFNIFGICVMILFWDFEFINDMGKIMVI